MLPFRSFDAGVGHRIVNPEPVGDFLVCRAEQQRPMESKEID